MNFSEALNLLKEGKRMTRKGWNSIYDPEYIYLETAKEEILLLGYDNDIDQLIIAFGYNYEMGRRIDIWNESYTSISFNLQEDILANDWEEYSDL